MQITWEESDIVPGLVVQNNSGSTYMVCRVIGLAYGTNEFMLVSLDRGSVYKLKDPTPAGIARMFTAELHERYILELR